jgi:hypothetical protein
MSTDTRTNGTVNNSPETISVAELLARHETRVANIVSLIRDKFEDEGRRNFEIGRETLADCIEQALSVKDYSSTDFDALMHRIRDEVRMYVAINPKSIKVAEWLKCHVLRELVSTEIGVDLSHKLSCFEYGQLIGKMLVFDKSALEGTIRAGWLDLVRGIANDRVSGRVTVEEFHARIKANEERLAELAANENPALAAKQATVDKLAKTAKETAKSKADVTESIANALTKGHLDPAGVSTVLENVAKELTLPMPVTYGFDPAVCTKADIDVLVSVMFSNGRFAEMTYLRDQLDKRIRAAETARDAAIAKADASTDTVKTRVAREQRHEETRRSKPSAKAPAMVASVA